jgi:hypothetical protein
MLRARARLIECDKQIKWNSYKLEECRQKYANQLCAYTGIIEDTWLIHDGTVLITKLGLDFTQRDCILNLVISEGVKNGRGRRSVWINPKM